MIGEELKNLSKDHTQSLKVLERILSLAENIGQAYESADLINKRSYLNLFLRSLNLKTER